MSPIRGSRSAFLIHDRSTPLPISGPAELSICSWNVLAHSLHLGWPGALDWESVRLPAFRRWLPRFAECDIVCFQELELGMMADMIQSALEALGFLVVFQERRATLVNAIFYKAHRFQLAWAMHRSRVLMAGLRLPDGRVVGVANVHLEASPNGAGEAQRDAQLKSMLQRLEGRELWCKVVTGDFNSTVAGGSALREQLVNDKLMMVPGPGPTWAVKGHHGVIDHMWVQMGLQPFKVLASPPADMMALLSSGLPNEEHPSDHLPIGAVFRIQPPDAKLSAGISVEDSEAGKPDEMILHEWVQIIRCAGALLRIGSEQKKKLKQATKEQQKMEGAFLKTLSSDDTVYLKAWRAGATTAASEAVARFTQNALIAVKKGITEFAESSQVGG